MVLPEGFALPPAGHLLPIVAVLLITGTVLWFRRPPVTDRVVAASVPWMVAGAGAHVLYQLDALPDPIAPLFGVPMVYLTVTAGAGVTWLLADLTVELGPKRAPAADLLFVGLLAAVLAVGATLRWGIQSGTVAPWWSAVAVVTSTIGAGLVWLGIRRWGRDVADATGFSGGLVLFAHTLDGVTTVIGLDVLDGAERSPLVDALVGWGGGLPTANLLGEAWPFVVLKVGLAVLVIVLIADAVEETPTTARSALLGVAALGLAPGVHNLLLFLVGG